MNSHYFVLINRSLSVVLSAEFAKVDGTTGFNEIQLDGGRDGLIIRNSELIVVAEVSEGVVIAVIIRALIELGIPAEVNFGDWPIERIACLVKVKCIFTELNH